MAGNSESAKKAAETNRKKDPLYYQKLGALGGKIGCTGGFFANRELARIAGAKGGRISRRTKKSATQN